MNDKKLNKLKNKYNYFQKVHQNDKIYLNQLKKDQKSFSLSNYFNHFRFS